MIKKILVPVDGAESSEKSVAQAVSLAEICGAKLYFLYVANINQLSINPNLTHAIMDAMRAAGTAILERAVSMLPPNVKCEKIMETGAPAAVSLGVVKGV